MSRKFIASILAASIAVTGFTAAPAAAGNDDLQKFLLGAGTLLIIGSALEAQHGKSRVIVKETHSNRDYAHGRNRHESYGKKKSRRYSKALPAYCLTKVRTRHGNVRMFGARCLNRNYRGADYLPRACKISVNTRRHGERQIRHGYKPGCLRHKGYFVAGRR